MIAAIVIGGAILIGSLVIFGPIGLLFGVIAVVFCKFMFRSGEWTSISEEDKQHARDFWGVDK